MAPKAFSRVYFPRPFLRPESANGPVRDVVERLSVHAEKQQVTLREVIEGFGPTSFLSVIMAVALLIVSPLSGIPLFSSLCGLTIAFVSAQMFWGVDHLWLPDFIMRQTVSGEKMCAALLKMRKAADWLDNKAERRLLFMVRGPMRKLLEFLCILCGGIMPFLELVPFSSSILGLATLLIATALLTRDGLFAATAAALMATAAMVPVTVLSAMTN
ncbi:exopolysaccharide biosynthesis protein [Donghicola sp. XS_ASV15]|uniref:exopolysaccharide biosynthesis protein n=1 Tax=Donghicola sp. XS_ASV15 TaxID=3241295 RepID=UPI003518976A